MKQLLFFILLVFSLGNAQAQGSINETLEPQVERLVKRFVSKNKNQSMVDGWRIQILATSDRQRMEQALRKFGDLYPSVPADWIHAKPYYKVRAGAFATKRDALRTLYILKENYPAAYPIQDDKIRPDELLR